MVITVAMQLILLETSLQDCSLSVLDGVHRFLRKYNCLLLHQNILQVNHHMKIRVCS